LFLFIAVYFAFAVGWLCRLETLDKARLQSAAGWQFVRNRGDAAAQTADGLSVHAKRCGF